MKKKRGRPPSRPEGLEVFNVLMTSEAKARLKALAQIEHTPAYVLLEGAFWNLWKELPEEKRQAADTVASIVAGKPLGKPKGS